MGAGYTGFDKATKQGDTNYFSTLSTDFTGFSASSYRARVYVGPGAVLSDDNFPPIALSPDGIYGENVWLTQCFNI